MKFNVFEDSAGWLHLQIPDIRLVWCNLDAEDVLKLICGLASAGSDFVKGNASGFSDWDMVCPNAESLGALVLDESGFSNDLGKVGKFLQELMFHFHVGDLETFGAC